MNEDPVAAADAARQTLNAQQAEELVITTITRYADSALRIARRHSLCADDAHDAYQRAMEILMRHAHRLDPERAGSWLHTVVKHEAMAVRRSRQRLVAAEEVDLDALEALTTPSPEECVLQFEHLSRSAEALQRLKPNEVRALWLKAAGNSYAEICDMTGWTYTKVNRCLAEGRRSFLERYAGIEAGEECVRWQPVLSAMVDGEATSEQLVQLRPHLRNCSACRATVRELHSTGTSLAGLFPAAGLSLATDHLEPASTFLTRLYETVAMTIHERTTSAVLRAQAVIDAVTAHKTAALAASAAAVAGGGVAAEEAAQLRKPRPREVSRATTLPTAPRREDSATSTKRAAPQPTITRPKSRSSARRSASRADTGHGAPRPGVARSIEPLVLPVEAERQATAVRASTTSPRARVGRTETASRNTANSEFGFEQP
jgi:RNA polymerase sigma factor (sigma-70 family)